MNIMNMVLSIGVFFMFFLFVSTVHAATIGRPINYVGLTNGLVGHWTFDGKDMGPNVRDISGQGNHGNLIGQTATTTVGGRMGQGLSFDGVDDYINIPAHSSLNVTNYTLSFWLYKNNDLCAASGFRDYVSKDDGNTFYVGEQCASPRRYLGHSPSQEVSVSGKFPVGRWVHVSGTFDTTNNTINFYQDGVLIGSGDTFTTDPPSTDSLTRIGAWSSVVPESFIFGKMDDVRIYNRALSASEIKQLYAMGATKLGLATPAGSSLSSGLVGHWTFDGKDMSPNVRDASGQGNHGNLSGQTATTSVGGRMGQALRFDGVDDYVDGGTIAALDSAVTATICGWVYRSSLADTTAFGTRSANGLGAYRFNVLWYSDNRMYFQYSNGTGNQYAFTSLVGLGWHHVCQVFNGSLSGDAKVAGYIDSSVVTLTYNLSPSATLGSNALQGPFIIGRETNDRYSKGIIDDVRIYNRALSASEIKQLYAMGATKLGLSTPAASSLSSGLVGHWTFDGKDMGPNVRDISGQGNHGDLSGQTATTSVGGRLGQALSFDGVDDYVQTDYVISNYPMTLCAWINPQHNAGDNLLDVFGSLGAFLLIVDLGDDTGFQFYDNADGVLNHSANVIFGKWQHVCAVIGTNGSNSYMYVNGMGEGPEDFTNIDYPDFSFSMGGVVSPDFKGSLDDIRIYNRALSASEVQQLYNMGR